MKRLFLAALLVLASACAHSGGGAFRSDAAAERKPWTHENFDADPDKFVFAIISDLTGGERAGVFDVAVEQLNLLRPEFIVSVGDLIDGVGENDDALNAEWDVFDARARKSRAPFFYVGGNHDLTGMPLRRIWEARYGARYYHFIYKDVLFLVLDTEDNSQARMAEIKAARDAAIKVLDGPNPEAAQTMEYFTMPERVVGAVGEEQAAYFQKVIAANPDVRWTFLLMHKPVWKREGENPFLRIEAALKDRPYTLFNGHFHSYAHSVRHDRDYVILGTTGGGQDPKDENAFDHVTMVAVGDGAPSIATLRMDGVLDKTGAPPRNGKDLCFQALKCASMTAPQ